MSLDKEDIIEVNQYNSVMINEYNGSITLQAINNGQDENYYQKWVFLSKWSKSAGGPVPDDKKRPMGVLLGDTVSDAKKTWQEIGRRMGWIDGVPRPKDDDIPF